MPTIKTFSSTFFARKSLSFSFGVQLRRYRDNKIDKSCRSEASALCLDSITTPGAYWCELQVISIVAIFVYYKVGISSFFLSESFFTSFVPFISSFNCGFAFSANVPIILSKYSGFQNFPSIFPHSSFVLRAFWKSFASSLACHSIDSLHTSMVRCASGVRELYSFIMALYFTWSSPWMTVSACIWRSSGLSMLRIPSRSSENLLPIASALSVGENQDIVSLSLILFGSISRPLI